VKLRFLGLLRPLAIVAAAIVVAVIMVKSRPQLQARSVDMPLPLVEVRTVHPGAVPVTVIAYGNVRAWRELDLAAQVTGRVTWQSANFEPGVRVRQGEPLLRIDPTDYRLAAAEARQALATAELALADARSLRQAARVEEATAMVEAARARIERAERDLANTEISAPYNAVIDTQTIEVGQFISTGTVIGRILGSDRAEIRLPITQQDIGFIDPQANSTVALQASVGPRQLKWQGQIARIEARIDEQTRVYPVVVTVDEPLNAERHGQELPFGLFVRAELVGDPVEHAVVIPQAALHGDSDLFLLRDGKLLRRHVTVERISEGGALVSDGLDDGDQVVITRLDLMFEGMQVALIDG
jgi:multidrug efflux pump subunit AcrA (membrane-fusion protein)